MENKTQLSVSTEVLEKLTERAALEIEGVKGIAKKAVDIRGAVKARSVVKAVKIESINGAIGITVYICVDSDVNIREVAEAVQQNIKDKVQGTTGSAVTRVTVNVEDIDFPEE
ncbi:MAG: Asp23/Gls24 family envelope stress response protein [Clostridia bacterium]|nr:Asp23/Gls24 family envelope stress response protein [Clostridia bacterium]MBR3592810.1 Asp23/Gls24 family envelope stress response protein [Clostridia bacterium]